MIVHKDWGADQPTVLKLYTILICSKIDYNCFIYGVARKSYQKSLQTVYHEVLRQVLGAFRTYPEECFYSEAHKPPLKIRFTKLGLQHYSKLKSLLSNPTCDCTFNPKQQNLFELSFHPWLLKQPVVILDLNKILKNKTHPLNYQEKLKNIQERYPNH